MSAAAVAAQQPAPKPDPDAAALATEAYIFGYPLVSMFVTGASHYMLHFPAGQTPPANAFWSVTMYSSDFFLVENAIKRSAMSSWNDLKKNADGSLDWKPPAVTMVH
jgi:hypothetical protein